jgi:DNA helicase-2/ATP-dependent DNA helicase PcrA
MFYVAVTRAKTFLHIYYVRERYNKTLLPSRFVNEIRFDSKSLQVGTHVKHRKYGTGVVTYMNQEKISIRFDENYGMKTFNVAYLLEHGLLVS